MRRRDNRFLLFARRSRGGVWHQIGFSVPRAESLLSEVKILSPSPIKRCARDSPSFRGSSLPLPESRLAIEHVSSHLDVGVVGKLKRLSDSVHCETSTPLAWLLRTAEAEDREGFDVTFPMADECDATSPLRRRSFAIKGKIAQLPSPNFLFDPPFSHRSQQGTSIGRGF